MAVVHWALARERDSMSPRNPGEKQSCDPDFSRVNPHKRASGIALYLVPGRSRIARKALFGFAPRRWAWFLLTVLCPFCMAFGPPVLTDADIPRQGLTLHQLCALRHVPAPELGAASAILVNTTTGQVVYSLNETERRAPASLSKIVTAIVALEKARQDEEIRVAQSDLRVYSVARLQNGERFTLRQLLFFLLIPSDNAAALTIARGVDGDESTFVNWMNETVARWGLSDTHFANPHGLDNKNAYSTAQDMAIIAYYAMRNPAFADIVGRPEALIAGRQLVSTNELLNAYSGMTGVKTGTTDRAGECLITMVDRPAGTCLSVVMGSQDRSVDTRLLLDYYYANYAELRIDLADTRQNRYLDLDNAWHAFRLREPLTMLVHPSRLPSASLYRRIDRPLTEPAPGQTIGALEVSITGERVAEVPLYAR